MRQIIGKIVPSKSPFSWSIVPCKVTHLSFFFSVLQRTASVDDDLAIFTQLQIVGIGEGFDSDKLYIAF